MQRNINLKREVWARKDATTNTTGHDLSREQKWSQTRHEELFLGFKVNR
jgi:hypothetical protein